MEGGGRGVAGKRGEAAMSVLNMPSSLLSSNKQDSLVSYLTVLC